MPLPEKDYFTLEEIIARWRFAGCDHATLLDYARRDLLVFSVYLRDLGNHKRTEETPQVRMTTTTTTAFSFISPDHKWQPIRYLKSDDARRILECRPNESAGVSVLYSSPARDKASGTGYMQAHYFTPANLLVTRAERDRFESEHKINLASSRLAKAWAWLADSTNQKALVIVGSAVAGFAAAAWTVYVWWFPKGSAP